MAKRKTIKNNPLDNLASEGAGPSLAGFEELLTETPQSSKEVAGKPITSKRTPASKERLPKARGVAKEGVILRGKSPIEGAPEPSPLVPVEPSPTLAGEGSEDDLVQRVTSLEEENRMQNILIGIIVAPLALLALLGAAAPIL